MYSDEATAAARRAAEAAAPLVAQLRTQLEQLGRAMGPFLEQLAASFATIKTRQEDFVLAPPPAAQKRTGRAAQESPYGPRRRRR